METLIFYEKPGCATNSRQKLKLSRAGIAFETRSLLAEKWTPDRLEKFFCGLPIEQWFNRAAPRIKKGEVQPDRVGAAQALALMVADPLLIRRPLLQRGDWRYVGFVWEEVAPRLGIAIAANDEPEVNLEGCSRGDGAHEQRCGGQA